MRIKFFLVAISLSVFSVGCSPQAESSATNGSLNNAGLTAASGEAGSAGAHADAHPTEGPHHGSLVELGNGEYHAEIVHDKAAVTVYLLGPAAKRAVSVDATVITINLLHDGEPKQFELVPRPESSDRLGKTSRFVLDNAELVNHLDDEAAKPKLIVTIEGTPYRGEIGHDHDQSDLDH